MAGKKRVGITFEVPRTSLMTAIEWEIFDDLLIGNFMKTTLHGLATLFDKDVSALVAKYGDNGRAFSEAEVAAYLAEYKVRCGAQLVRDMLMSKTADLAKRVIRNKNGYPFRVARRMYFLLKS
jgi:hypothetical protein